MKDFWREVGIAVILGLVIPGVILHLTVEQSKSLPGEAPPQIAHETIPSTMIRILDKEGSVCEMELETYLQGVVLAEMPASFEPEALKAQAVVARTYTLRAEQGKSKHENAAVCMDSTCCQAYTDPSDYLERGGSSDGIDKVSAAVQETKGYVLTFEGELIEATYFSCSGGSTEDAVAVWGTDVAYLQATPSPGEEHAAHYADSTTFSREELEQKLGISLAEDASGWVTKMNFTAGGGVDTVFVGGKSFRGTDLRKLLNLYSTAFTVTAGADSLTFHTRGYGHRVGMSQYGADAMAASGSTYGQILEHYYQGTVLEKWNN